MESRRTSFLAQYTEWMMNPPTQIGTIRGELGFKGCWRVYFGEY